MFDGILYCCYGFLLLTAQVEFFRGKGQLGDLVGLAGAAVEGIVFCRNIHW